MKKESIAIVGIGCRFPGGASSPKAFWNLLRKKKDAIVDVPPERWDIRRFYDEDPAKPGKTYVKQGGFLKEKIDRFDPLFFGISPREAENLDPQQRLLLEVTWEAFEDGGLIESELRGSQTGVFVGGFCMDSMLMRFGQLNREVANSHSAASSTMTMLSNRISYTFDLKGPSVTMDTACSSSLVATHFACQSIWSGESESAIVGGVNVMLRPEFPIVMSKGKFLSPHGRCKAFDEDAAGYGRGEGAGVVILKPLSKALENGDRIYGLIKETGTNQDGRTAGITLPDSESQEVLVRDVYRRAGVNAGDIDFVEAHGTGTQAGDPAEIKALHKVLQEGREEKGKCYVGSVKTNIGHLEAGAGVAGLIKAVLSLHNEAIPPNLHFENPSSKISWDEICIQIPTEITEWKRSDQIRYAGVNSFGYGGANAHVLLQEAPIPSDTISGSEAEWEKPLLVPVSARSEAAMREVAAKYAFHLAMNSDAKAVADFCHTVSCRRHHHSHRAAILAADLESLRTRLQQFSTGESVEQSSIGLADEKAAERLVFVYTGMGPQWWAMGRELMNAEPVFLQALEECDKEFRKQAGWSIIDELNAEESNSRMAKTEVAQPANFVIQVGLTRLWESWGIQPYSVIGHSVGEVAAAYVSGALTLKDAITVSLYRSQLQQTLAGKGAMVAVGLSERKALERIASYERVSIAAINSPSSVTLSGDKEQIEKMAQELELDGLFVRRLDVEVAYHSSQMDPIEAKLREALSSIEPKVAQIPLYSTVVGARILGDGMNAEYWWHNVREPVRFLDGIRALLGEGCTDFLEIGPHPVLGHSIKEIATESDTNIRLTPSLNRKNPEQWRMLESLGQLYAQGQTIAWKSVSPLGGTLAQLPTYPWQKEKYWIESPESLEDRISQRKGVYLNRKIAAPQPIWSVEINEQFFPYLKDHVVNGQIVFPGACYLEAGLMLARELGAGEALSEIRFHSMLQQDERATQSLYLSHDTKSENFYVHSRTYAEDEQWQLHASGKLSEIEVASKIRTIDLEALKRSFSSESSTTDMYAMLGRRGLQYGESFKRAKRLWIQDQDFLVEIEPEEKGNSSDSIVSPEVLDTAFHSLLSLVEGEEPFVPQKLDQISVYGSIKSLKWIHGTITRRTADWFNARLKMMDGEGNLCLEIREVFMRRLPGIRAMDSSGIGDLLYAPKWQEYGFEIDEGSPIRDEKFVLLVPTDPVFKGIEESIRSTGMECISVSKGSVFQQEAADRFQINENKNEHFSRLLQEIGFDRPLHIVHLWPLDVKAEPLDYEAIVNECLVASRLIGAIARSGGNGHSITIVTKGAQSVKYEAGLSGLNASALNGLPQLVENEIENVECRILDLDPGDDQDKHPLWINRLLSAASALPKDLAIREGKLYSMSLDRFSMESELPRETWEDVSTDEAVVLDSSHLTGSRGYAYLREARPAPGPNEIELKTHLIYTSEIGGDDARGDSRVFSEFAGIVTETGENANSFRKGDRVLALGGNKVGSYSAFRGDQVVRIPDSFDFKEFLGFRNAMVSYYALVEIANIKQGERVLIDQSLEDVGWFAIQIAKWKGAEVLLVGTGLEKVKRFEKSGADHILSGASEGIVDEVNAITQGKGVDVVLSDHSNKRLRNTLEVLTAGGFYLEIWNSKTSSDLSFPKAALEKNILFSVLDVDRLYLEGSPRALALVERIRDGFIEGWLKSVPIEGFSADDLESALEYLGGLDDRGSIALQFDQKKVKAYTRVGDKNEERRTGTVVVTGGNSGFGLETAKWLAGNSDYRIVLLSRSGATSKEILDTIDELRANDVDVISESIDVADLDQLRDLIARIDGKGPAVCGVIHAAMVLEDAFIQDLDAEKWNKVMAPKVLGLMNLYQCVKDRNMEFFVSYSSISSLVGNRGQANYVAANSFLDAFSRRLRSIGFPAISINWGALAETGIVARNEIVGQLLEKEGVIGISNQQALAGLEMALSLGLGQLGVFDVNWDQWWQANPSAERSSRFASLMKDRRKSAENDKAIVLVEELENIESQDKLPFLTNLVMNGLSKVLKIPVSKIKPDNTLDNLGIDSLMLIELSLTILSEFGLNIPAAELPKYPTVTSLASNIQERLDRIRRTLAA